MNTQSAEIADKPERKQQQRSVVTQQKLLDAAIEAFSENGFKGTSTRDIADRAGVHHPLITYHFRNKDQLWRAATDRIFREFNISLVKAMAEGRTADAEAIHEKYESLFKTLMSIDTNPVPIKSAVAMQGHCTDELRLPLVNLSENNTTTLRTTLSDYDLI